MCVERRSCAIAPSHVGVHKAQSTSFTLKPTTSLARKVSHHSGSILSKKTLHISSSHELKQNEARQRLQANTNALHNILMIELTERQGHSNTKGDNVSTDMTDTCHVHSASSFNDLDRSKLLNKF